jgi:hypothetical protein
VCRNVLRDLGEDPVEGLNMIDAIQRLGIDHYFQEEIGAILHRQYVESISHGDFGQDLHEVALSFRLLRQQGYFVPAGGYYFLFKSDEFNYLIMILRIINYDTLPIYCLIQMYLIASRTRRESLKKN